MPWGHFNGDAAAQALQFADVRCRAEVLATQTYQTPSGNLPDFPQIWITTSTATSASERIKACGGMPDCRLKSSLPRWDFCSIVR